MVQSLIRSIDGVFRSFGKLTILCIALSCTSLLGALDYLTGFQVSFAVFYLLPVTVTAWYAGYKEGFFVSVLSAVTWHLANHLAGERFAFALIPYWNASTRFVFFVIVTLLLDHARRTIDIERASARSDFLTGAFNARAFYDIAATEMARALRYGHPFTLAYIDLDHFKEMNDRFGHRKGDEVLRRVVEAIQERIRKNDVLARLGGDEFAMLLPETDTQAAQKIMIRLKDDLMTEMRRHEWCITFSMGVLTCTNPSMELDEIVRRADELMYKVKNSGRDNIRFDSCG